MHTKPAFSEGFALRHAAPASQASLLSYDPAQRSDLPPVQTYARGSANRAIDIVRNPDSRHRAVAVARVHAYAATSKAARSAKLLLWDRLVKEAKLPAGAFTAEHMWTVVSSLKAANFRSATSYLDVAKQRFLESGGIWTDELDLARKRLVRSCKRGLGPPSRAAPFPLWACREHPVEDAPFSKDGPIRPLAVCIISCWWLLREIEAAAASCVDVEDTTPSTCALHLSSSKSDTEAKGVFRELSCVCGQCPGTKSLVPQALCPVCIIRSRKKRILLAFPTLDSPPLFPTLNGRPPTKAAMVTTIAAAASALGEPARTRSGAERWGGHALRRGGVHFLAAAGVPTLDIQLHARHSSSAIMAYLDGANLAQLRSMFARACASEVSLIPSATANPGQALEARAPACASVSPPSLVVAVNRIRIVHGVDVSHPQRTLCKWYWQDSPKAEPFRPASTYNRCKKCWSLRKSSHGPVPITPTRSERLALKSLQ